MASLYGASRSHSFYTPHSGIPLDKQSARRTNLYLTTHSTRNRQSMPLAGIFLNQYMVVFLFNTVIYVFLLLGPCILIVQLPCLRFFLAFSSVVRQMSGYNSTRRGTARTLPKFLCCSTYCLFCVVLCIVCV